MASPLAGPFVVSALLFGVAALGLGLLMRADPSLVARAASAHSSADPSGGARPGMGGALKAVASRAPTILGVSAMAAGHLVMIGVMAMTPVHIRDAGGDATQTLRVVGLVLPFHIAGMFAFPPFSAWLTDRLGARATIFTGIALLPTACALAGSAGHHAPRLTTWLMVLGLGWSATMVAGSTLLRESIPLELRPSAQGLADLTMGLAGAPAGALSGVVMPAWDTPCWLCWQR
jgi:MFS family permease